MRFSSLLVPLVGAALAAPAVAHGDDAPAPDAERVVTAPPAPSTPPRPWLYLDDPTIPAPLRVIGFSRATYGAIDGTPSRPFGTDAARPGGIVESGAEAGLLTWLSLAASGYASTATPVGASSAGVVAGVRVAPLEGSADATRLVLSAGVLRDLSGGAGAWGRVSLTRDWGRARLAAMVHGERVFQAARDGVDVMVSAGASYEATRALRLGVEYVGQDVEEVLDGDAEGGARHFVGPTVAVELLDRRLTINAGPSIGLSSGSARMFGRLGIGYAF